MKERISDMSYTTVEIEIPEEMKPYIEIDNVDDVLRRNALLLYPHVLNKRISHGKAAEILGIPKLDLIDIYAQMGFCYLDQTMDKLDKDLQTFKELGLNEVTP